MPTARRSHLGSTTRPATRDRSALASRARQRPSRSTRSPPGAALSGDRDSDRRRARARRRGAGAWLVRGTVGWFLFPAVIAIAVPVIIVVVDRDPGIVAWPFAAAAVVCGLFAWSLYEARARTRAVARHGGVGVHRHHRLWRDISVAARAVPQRLDHQRGRRQRLQGPQVATTAIIRTEPRVPTRRRPAPHRRRRRRRVPASRRLSFALIDAHSARAFVQRADAVGLRYVPAQRIDGYKISIGRTVVLSMFRSVNVP